MLRFPWAFSRRHLTIQQNFINKNETRTDVFQLGTLSSRQFKNLFRTKSPELFATRMTRFTCTNRPFVCGCVVLLGICRRQCCLFFKSQRPIDSAECGVEQVSCSLARCRLMTSLIPRKLQGQIEVRLIAPRCSGVMLQTKLQDYVYNMCTWNWRCTQRKNDRVLTLLRFGSCEITP